MEQKEWLKITITTEAQLVDSLTDFLTGIIGAGVESGAEDTANYGTITVWMDKANYSEDERSRLLTQIEEHIALLEDAFQLSGTTLSWQLVADKDWGAEWKKFFTPFSLVENLVIVPSWEEYSAQGEEQVLRMDPGMAFGTGHHATTRLSLELIRKSIERKGGRTMLDVGTGTGILSMGAALFGMEYALAIDNDPDAVAAAKENIKRNNLEKGGGKGIAVSALSLQEIEGKFDIIAANIIHDTLIALSGDLVKRLAPGGELILSGILTEGQLDTICEVFSALGVEKREVRSSEEWAAVCFTNLQ